MSQDGIVDENSNDTVDMGFTIDLTNNYKESFTESYSKSHLGSEYICLLLEKGQLSASVDISINNFSVEKCQFIFKKMKEKLLAYEDFIANKISYDDYELIELYCNEKIKGVI